MCIRDSNELERGAGTQFDPELVPVFIGLLKDGMIRPALNLSLIHI